MNAIPALSNSILNQGLSLAMEFGKHWLQPIQSRLGALYPELDETTLDLYNAVCRKAMDKGHKFVYAKLDAMAGAGNKIAQKELKQLLDEHLTAQFPWVDEEYLGRLLSQGCYYAYKDGLDGALT